MFTVCHRHHALLAAVICECDQNYLIDKTLFAVAADYLSHKGKVMTVSNWNGMR